VVGHNFEKQNTPDTFGTLVLEPTGKTRSDMGLFKSSAVAAAFKLPTPTESGDTSSKTVNLVNPYGSSTPKTRLAKNAAGLDYHVICLVMPLLKDGKYKDCPDNDSELAIKEQLDNFAEIEEPLFLVANNEWLEEWDSTHERINLGDLGDSIEEDIMTNYFQRLTEKVGYESKEVWRVAIAGITDAAAFITSVKQHLVAAKYEMIIDWNFFPEILEFNAGWLCGTDPTVIQRTDISVAIEKAVSSLDAETLKLAAGEEESDHNPHFIIKTQNGTQHQKRITPERQHLLCLLFASKRT
jgi:hypothetical protein